MKGKSVTRTCTQHIASHKKIALTSIPTTSAGKIPVGKAARYGLDDSEIESHSEMGGQGPVFPANVQIASGGHPTSHTIGTESFPGVNRPGRGVDHPPPN